MRLATLECDGLAKVVAVTPDERYVDLTACDDSIPTTLRGILAAADGLSRVAGALVKGMANGPFVTGKLLAPIGDPSKVICIGLNYRDHALETKATIPSEPVVFNKFPQTVVGPEAHVVLPGVSNEVDYEAELVVVIGKAGKHIPAAKALEHVAGYTIGNDISARDWQKGRPGGQWLMGKTPDTFAPTGPWLVTHDEIGDPHDLAISLKLNGATMQNSNTKELIFTVEALIAHISQLITLLPGDLIFTGTPSGVGTARSPQVYLKAGDRMEVTIEGIGTLVNSVVAE